LRFYQARLAELVNAALAMDEPLIRMADMPDREAVLDQIHVAVAERVWEMHRREHGESDDARQLFEIAHLTVRDAAGELALIAKFMAEQMG
jgi:hypothetical protein